MGRNRDDYYYEEVYSTETEETTIGNEIEIGCGFCRDKRKNKDIELYFLDRANNMRPCSYCPSCGRKLG
jgi:hypothetical protein